MPAALRVGSVPYLVGRPLDLELEREPGIELVRDVPAALAERLAAGAIDAALLSSIELFRRPGYRYLDGLAVAGRGRVASVQVFLRRPLAELRRIALDPASRAAAALVRVLLDPDSTLRAAGAPARAPELVELAPGSDPSQAEADAWLAIGDAALRAALAPDAPARFDPCAAWTRATGLPFAFALWIVRPGAPIEPHLAAFARSRARGRAAVPALALQAAREWGLPPEACRRYLAEECLYEPGAELAPALHAFRDAAARLGLCREDLPAEPIRTPEHVA